MACSGIWQNILELTCTWDLGRRCSLDCSYCPPHRHNNWSPDASFEDLKQAARLPLSYSQTLRTYADIEIRTQVNFTGGEPTLNPHFLDLCDYVHGEDPRMRLGLTTNGLFTEEYARKAADKLHNIVISYHCEANSAAKKVINENTVLLNEIKKSENQRINNLRVNLMVHAKEEYFNECVELAEFYKENDIKFIPRYIGEHPGDPSAHKYTDEQLQFFKNNWENKKTAKSCSSQSSPKKNSDSEDKKEGKAIGRPCCGGRTFKMVEVSSSADSDEINDLLANSTNATHIVERNFKDWYCFVNLFFLHIEQEQGLVYYHQTCQANHKGERGPIGKISEMDKIVENFERSFKENTLEPLICPNKRCNCGLCITKSTSKTFMDEFKNKVFSGMS